MHVWPISPGCRILDWRKTALKPGIAKACLRANLWIIWGLFVIANAANSLSVNAPSENGCFIAPRFVHDDEYSLPAQ